MTATTQTPNIEVGSLVVFKPGLYPDEEGAVYRVLEVNGDRCFIRFVCDNLPFPPVSVARTAELVNA